MGSLADLAQRAIETARARGASYADARAVVLRQQQVEVKQGRVAGISETEDVGLGVRAIASGAWGFSSCADPDAARADAAAARAVEVARASALFRRDAVRLAPEPACQAAWESPCAEDPFGVPLSEKVDLLLRTDALLRAVSGITLTELYVNCAREEKEFASTEGSRIRQVRTVTGAGYTAYAFRDGEITQRTYPSSHGGRTALMGYELVRALRLPEEAPRIAEEAVALLSAPVCPSGRTDLILMGDQLALQIHESCGHPIELDRVLGDEANFAGTSFLTPDKLGSFRYGSPAVNLVADATPEHGPGLGTFAYDDEGVEAQRTWIVREGLFSGYLTSRETAAALSLPRSGGTMRADLSRRLPLIRMTNVSLLPGTWDLDALVADTREGVLMQTNQSWSIDDRRLNFQFGCEIGWEIKDGRRGRMLRRPTYAGITPEFWGSCDAVCGQKSWTLWGTPNCGKGQPLQVIGTGHGASPARFRNVQVGVAP